LNEDLGRLRENGARVYAVVDDAAERGIDSKNCIAGIELIKRGEVARLFDTHDQVWHW
jgi:sulfur transfer complex TusBCD TusB component (DsrH family)